jgi:hypothetical protein
MKVIGGMPQEGGLPDTTVPQDQRVEIRRGCTQHSFKLVLAIDKQISVWRRFKQWSGIQPHLKHILQ